MEPSSPVRPTAPVALWLAAVIVGLQAMVALAGAAWLGYVGLNSFRPLGVGPDADLGRALTRAALALGALAAVLGAALTLGLFHLLKGRNGGRVILLVTEGAICLLTVAAASTTGGRFGGIALFAPALAVLACLGQAPPRRR